ncbi:DUF1351 domain-containing protein [Enterococcus dongliensis]|uniref:DUF1351 domain-containing protein n=1 Tax=Enterococcus dongliensis TaxID=2559925 RepID=A0ABU3EQG4_9ENTE|nr:DUF1351 domain-containing protein [Enterococcus dongliensis]MDT2597102.1 DUF1351 domain-containing protein [Enterococcus dongliensis]MDT2648110.1 DUF1351 domain-containing protein [Enterococcus dongliensis]
MEISELSTELEVGVRYTPSEIIIENEDYLAKSVDNLVSLYSSFVFTDDNVPEAKNAKTSLNKVKKILEDQRKDVKKKYSEPLNVFEERIKSYVEKIDSVKNNIDAGIKDFEEREREKRQLVLDQVIADMAPNYEILVEELEVDPSWANKTNFTKKGEVNSKTVKIIADKMGFIALEKRRIEGDKKTVQTFADLNGLEPYAWENLIVQGHRVNDVLERMKQASEQKKRDEEERARQSAAEKEYQEAMAKLEQEQQQTIGDKIIDQETGEVVEEIIEDEILKFTLEISGPKSKLYKLNQYMTEQGIEFKKIFD